MNENMRSFAERLIGQREQGRRGEKLEAVPIPEKLSLSSFEEREDQPELGERNHSRQEDGMKTRRNHQ